jgi:hypothetical protein
VGSGQKIDFPSSPPQKTRTPQANTMTHYIPYQANCRDMSDMDEVIDADLIPVYHLGAFPTDDRTGLFYQCWNGGGFLRNGDKFETVEYNPDTQEFEFTPTDKKFSIKIVDAEEEDDDYYCHPALQWFPDLKKVMVLVPTHPS